MGTSKATPHAKHSDSHTDLICMQGRLNIAHDASCLQGIRKILHRNQKVVDEHHRRTGVLPPVEGDMPDEEDMGDVTVAEVIDNSTHHHHEAAKPPDPKPKDDEVKAVSILRRLAPYLVGGVIGGGTLTGGMLLADKVLDLIGGRTPTETPAPPPDSDTKYDLRGGGWVD